MMTDIKISPFYRLQSQKNHDHIIKLLGRTLNTFLAFINYPLGFYQSEQKKKNTIKNDVEVNYGCY